MTGRIISKMYIYIYSGPLLICTSVMTGRTISKMCVYIYSGPLLICTSVMTGRIISKMYIYIYIQWPLAYLHLSYAKTQILRKVKYAHMRTIIRHVRRLFTIMDGCVRLAILVLIRLTSATAPFLLETLSLDLSLDCTIYFFLKMKFTFAWSQFTQRDRLMVKQETEVEELGLLLQ